MTRMRILIVLGMAVMGVFGLGAQASMRAQEATPEPVAADLTTYSTALVGLLPGVSLPPAADIVAVRAEFAPGVSVPFAAGPDSADTLLILETGELTVTVANQSWRISRESVLNQAMASPAADGDLFKLSLHIAAGEQGTLSAGDMTVIPATADGEMRNATTEPVTALMILLGPSAGVAATPAP